MRASPSAAERPEPQSSTNRWPLWFAIATAWWTLNGLATISTYRGMSDVSWEHAIRVSLASAGLWIPQTVFALWLAERFPLDPETWRRRAPLYLLAVAAVVLLRAAIVFSTNQSVGWYTELPGFSTVLTTSIANNLLLFPLMAGLGHALVFSRRYRERNEQLARVELQHLKMQLHPHFLFNTLNTINAYVRTEPDVASGMITRLSELLRHALDSTGTHEVVLQEELRVLGAYLDIEQLRFEDRLRVEWKIDPGTLAARVPHLILQPLVENAVRHGISARSTTGTISIAALRRNGSLQLQISDDGVGLHHSRAPRTGVGLSNTRNRLQQLYGSAGSLEVGASDTGGVCVSLTLPFRPATP
jgi:sensor histidine kinase YesM